MDGEIVIELAKLSDEQAPDPASEGSVALAASPAARAWARSPPAGAT